MSTATLSNTIAPGTIVRLRGITNSPEMYFVECDRSSADCVWFKHNADLSRARFPNWALKRVNPDGNDSGELAALT